MTASDVLYVTCDDCGHRQIAEEGCSPFVTTICGSCGKRVRNIHELTIKDCGAGSMGSDIDALITDAFVSLFGAPKHVVVFEYPVRSGEHNMRERDFISPMVGAE